MEPYGEPAALSGVPNPKIGIYANDSNAAVTTRDDAVFDYFRITPGLPDTTAPATTHDARAGRARRPNGWYRSGDADARHRGGRHHAVQGRQRRLRGLRGPVTLSGPGTTTVTYRSTDAEGNVEADKTVTVKIDQVARTATLDPAQPVRAGPTGVRERGARGRRAAGGAGLEARVPPGRR